jgi:hypothetical protein
MESVILGMPCIVQNMSQGTRSLAMLVSNFTLKEERTFLLNM